MLARMLNFPQPSLAMISMAACSSCCLRSLIAVVVQAIDVSGDILEHVI
jgi:hypothetical protein